MSDWDRILKAGSYQGTVKPLFQRQQDFLLRREVHEAMLQADNLLRLASQDAAAIREQARQQGLRQGLKEVAAILEQAEEHRKEILRRCEGEVVPLAVSVARKLIAHALEVNPRIMVDLWEQALEETSAARRVDIRVAPESLRLLAPTQDRLLSATGGTVLTIVPDESLKPGDCIIETEVGQIDARIDTQLQTILEGLLAPEE